MGTLTMSAKERRRLEVLGLVRAEKISLVTGAKLLGLSYRQMKRSWARFQQQGDPGLVHGLRGKPSNRGSDARREQALQLYQEKYAGYGPTLAAECLAEEDKLSVPRTTLQGWATQAGVWRRQRKGKQHRRRRSRREHFGELLQFDGSHHDWFEGRRATAVLMVLIDDATSRVFARFFENESWDSSAQMVRRYAQLHGLPRALYVDRHGIYRADRDPTAEEILAGKTPETQFGRAMRELNVELILARSPQAKGRVERVNRTLQDRLVKELTRRGISDLATANAYLEQTYLASFNARFGKPAALAADVHQPAADEAVLRVLSFQEDRVVQPDWTVRWQNGFFQLSRPAARHVQPGDRVVVSQQIDGRMRIFAGEQELSWTTACVTAPPQSHPTTGPTGSSQGQKPAANHPWRRGLGVSPTSAAADGGPCSASVATLPSRNTAPRPETPTSHPQPK